jgi:hypothetical protein
MYPKLYGVYPNGNDLVPVSVAHCAGGQNPGDHGMDVRLAKIVVIGVPINCSQGLPRGDGVFCVKHPMNADRTRFSSSDSD